MKGYIQLEQCSRAWKPIACCSGEGWGFYFNFGFGGLFSLAMDLRAFLDELVCFPLIGWGGAILRVFCSSVLWQIYQTLYLLCRMQEYRFTPPSQDAGMQIYNSSGYKNHSALHGVMGYPLIQTNKSPL
jgi:hypothetical protein